MSAPRLVRAGLLAAALGSVFAPAAFGGEPELVGVGFTRVLFTGVNMNDAQAAIKVWIDAVVRAAGLPVRADTRIYDGVEDLRPALAAGRVDVVAATVVEFMDLEKEASLEHILIGVQSHESDGEYVLLVHKDSEFMKPADLRGRRILYWSNPRTCLIQDWLHSLLREETGAAGEGSFASITSQEKLSAVILPVFFQQADACLVTRGAWQTMGELNPQVTMKLRHLARSPDIVPMVIFFRAEYRSPLRQKVIEALENMEQTPSGRQILTLFHGVAVKEAPLSALDSARALHDQARVAESATRAPVAARKALSKAGLAGGGGGR